MATKCVIDFIVVGAGLITPRSFHFATQHAFLSDGTGACRKKPGRCGRDDSSCQVKFQKDTIYGEVGQFPATAFTKMG